MPVVEPEVTEVITEKVLATQSQPPSFLFNSCLPAAFTVGWCSAFLCTWCQRHVETTVHLTIWKI